MIESNDTEKIMQSLCDMLRNGQLFDIILANDICKANHGYYKQLFYKWQHECYKETGKWPDISYSSFVHYLNKRWIDEYDELEIYESE